MVFALGSYKCLIKSYQLYFFLHFTFIFAMSPNDPFKIRRFLALFCIFCVIWMCMSIVDWNKCVPHFFCPFPSPLPLPSPSLLPLPLPSPSPSPLPLPSPPPPPPSPSPSPSPSNKAGWAFTVNCSGVNTVPFTRDLVRHGNVTLNVTYPIFGSSADKSMFFCFLLYFGQQSQLNLNHHRAIHAWPCTSQ